jgi:hypothetical protein
MDHVVWLRFNAIDKAIAAVSAKLEMVMATEQEFLDRITAAEAKVDKIASETAASLVLVQELKDQLANLPGFQTTAAIDAKFAELEAKLQGVDDQVADAPAP